MLNTIYEYSEVTDTKLKDYIVATPQLHKYFKFDWNVLKTKQYCGILNFEGKNFYLLPKIAYKNDAETNLDIFIYMLMYAYDIKLENEDIASCKNEKNNTILEVFIQLFARNLFHEFQRGIYKEYITEQDNLTTLRGKYLVNENLKYNFIKNKIYCEYDEFSMNNALNQFFLYAVKTLLPFTKNKKLLKQCELVLDEVEYSTLDINTLYVSFNRLNSRFQESFEFAKLLLNKSVPLFSKDKKSFAFLFDMNVLFERFVGKMVQELKPGTQLQNEKRFADLTLKPDIIINDTIIDTKYKKLNSKEDIKQSDKYQMFAYGKNYGKTNTMLLYPKHLEHFDYELKLGEVMLHVKSLDLDCEECGYGKYVEIMKIRMENLF
ncbi:restriction endonuclease [Sulfurimonas sp. HSL-1716]|uniref:McrC family protein n=1 Tax=Hydrocurvibacter sulfurireducens TaxID=3131937 RepID=UPI0031F83735